MRGVSTALVLLAILGVASGVSAADVGKSLALQEALRLCVASHSDVDQTTAAADASGWAADPKHAAGALGFNAKPGPGMQFKSEARLKAFGLDHLELYVDDMRFRALHNRTCSVSDEGPGSTHIPAAMRAMFGVEPSAQNGHFWEWIYEDGPSGRRFVRDDPNAADPPMAATIAQTHPWPGATVVTMGVTVGPGFGNIRYSESAWNGSDPAPPSTGMAVAGAR